MEELSAKKHGTPSTSVNFVSDHMLDQKKCEIQDMIARRAYELFEHRARVPGHEIQDWLQAESELLYPCCHDLKESAEAIVIRVELPGSLAADELAVSVEPRCLIVSGDREIDVLFGDASDTHWEPRTQQIFRLHNLSADVDPSKATATQKGHTVEIVLPKACATSERNERTRSASSGR